MPRGKPRNRKPSCWNPWAQVVLLNPSPSVGASLGWFVHKVGMTLTLSVPSWLLYVSYPPCSTHLRLGRGREVTVTFQNRCSSKIQKVKGRQGEKELANKSSWLSHCSSCGWASVHSLIPFVLVDILGLRM